MLRTLSSLQFWQQSEQRSEAQPSAATWVSKRFSRLLSPCAFGHGQTLRTRDQEGHLALECADCGHVMRVLETPMIKGPKHRATPVLGAPTTTAKVVKQDRFRRSA